PGWKPTTTSPGAAEPAGRSRACNVPPYAGPGTAALAASRAENCSGGCRVAQSTGTAARAVATRTTRPRTTGTRHRGRIALSFRRRAPVYAHLATRGTKIYVSSLVRGHFSDGTPAPPMEAFLESSTGPTVKGDEDGADRRHRSRHGAPLIANGQD